MQRKNTKIVIVSATSGIGFHLALSWAQLGHQITGTFRCNNADIGLLREQKVTMLECDLCEDASMSRFANQIDVWDVLVLCPGTMEPIGSFEQVNFSIWKKSIEVNLVSQLDLLHKLLPKRQKGFNHGPAVIFFAGGGTNSAPLNYSAYTASKIALIKMVELLDAEMSDTRFSIIGPGWVNTKIHQETLDAGQHAGLNYEITINKLARNNEMTPLNDIFECCNWIVNSPKKVVGGRNFSVVHDRWGSKELDNQLTQNPDMYKLRRYMN